MLALGYYGLLRVGEMAFSEHAIQCKNVHVAKNKNKIRLYLYSSKTHDESSRPQSIKITAAEDLFKNNMFFCPFTLARQFIKLRGRTAKGQFFAFSDGSPVLPAQFRAVLKTLISNIGLDADLYNVQSLRIGRASDLVNKFGYSVQDVKFTGRWKSDAVYKYIRM